MLAREDGTVRGAGDLGCRCVKSKGRQRRQRKARGPKTQTIVMLINVIAAAGFSSLLVKFVMTASVSAIRCSIQRA